MTDICIHPILTFGSGDYYIICRDCGQNWAIVGKSYNHPEDQPQEILDLQNELRIRSIMKAYLSTGTGDDQDN